jgi:hypothetical protein
VFSRQKPDTNRQVHAMTNDVEPTTSARWLDGDKRIILVEFRGNLSGEIMVTSVKLANAMMDTVDHPVIVIHNFQGSGKVQGTVVGYLPEIGRMHHRNNVQPMMIGTGGRFRAVAALYSRLFKPILIFETLGGALEHVRSKMGIEVGET